MHQLLASNDKVKGCELLFPDTAFFKKGKPVIVIKSDPRDFCLVGVKHHKKISLASIYKDFQNVVRRRKKDQLGHFGRKFSKARMRASISPSEMGRIISKEGGMQHKRTNSILRKGQLELTSSGNFSG